MNIQIKLSFRLFFALVWCAYPFGIAEAKTDINEKLWDEEAKSFYTETKQENKTETRVLADASMILDVLDLKKMDILDVLKLISQKSGLNIVAGQDVKGKVTVFLKDIQVREALRVIVEAYGWAYVQDGDVLRIMSDKEHTQKYGHRFGQTLETRICQLSFIETASAVAVINQIKSDSGKVIEAENSGTLILRDEPQKLDEMEAILQRMDVPVETEVFRLSYAKSEELSLKVEELLTPSVGTMNYDGRSNTLVVSDTAEAVDEIRQIIQAFDRQDREVLIEAKIVQVVLSDEHKLGIDWQAVVEEYHGLSLKNNFDILGDSEKRGMLSIGTIADDGYTAVVEALETIGNTEILSSPRIMAINNQEAKILVGSTEPYVTTTTTTPSSGPTTTAESVNFIEVGVKLFVTPTIHEDDFITMKIRPEVSSVTSNVTTSNNNTIPVVETSEAETTVMVKDKKTIVIGGLIKEEKIKATKKIPFLGSIPVLGLAFQNKRDYSSKTEIVILLTPRIISGDVEETAFFKAR